MKRSKNQINGVVDAAEVVESLGEFIRLQRQNRGLGLTEMARQIAISPQTLLDIERSRRYPSDKVLAKIAGLLRIDEEEFKALDPRIVVEQLKEMVEANPSLRQAFSTALRRIRLGEETPENLAKRLASGK